ncbi:hypothetical protein DFH09DRAFT_1372325 [Mycena vulgaris]|nr:hypothetical protein DFH09DRAFT_1372325 [Mycena vulgaris]
MSYCGHGYGARPAPPQAHLGRHGQIGRDHGGRAHLRPRPLWRHDARHASIDDLEQARSSDGHLPSRTSTAPHEGRRRGNAPRPRRPTRSSMPAMLLHDHLHLLFAAGLSEWFGAGSKARTAALGVVQDALPFVLFFFSWFSGRMELLLERGAGVKALRCVPPSAVLTDTFWRWARAHTTWSTPPRTLPRGGTGLRRVPPRCAANADSRARRDAAKARREGLRIGTELFSPSPQLPKDYKTDLGSVSIDVTRESQ